MTTTKTEGTAAPTTSLGTRLDGAKQIATELPGALTVGSRAYVNGVLELGRTLVGFGREIATEAGRHVRATIEARSLREVAELQAGWVQHRVETPRPRPRSSPISPTPRRWTLSRPSLRC